MQNTVEMPLFHVLFWLENEMCSLAPTVAPSSIVKQGKMQDGADGGRWRQRDWKCFEIPMGREIWFQNRVVSEFSESQKFCVV